MPESTFLSVSLLSLSLRSTSPISSVSHLLVSLRFLKLCLSFYIPPLLSLLFSPSFCLPGPFSFTLSPYLHTPLFSCFSCSLSSLPFSLSIFPYPSVSLSLSFSFLSLFFRSPSLPAFPSVSVLFSSPRPLSLYLSLTVPAALPPPPPPHPGRFAAVSWRTDNLAAAAAPAPPPPSPSRPGQQEKGAELRATGGGGVRVWGSDGWPALDRGQVSPGACALRGS